MAPSITQPRSFKGEWAAQRHAFKHVPRHDCAVNMYVSKHYINPNKLDISCQMVSNAWWLPRLPLKWSHKFPVCIRFCTYQKTNTMLLNCHVFLGNYWSTGGGKKFLLRPLIGLLGCAPNHCALKAIAASILPKTNPVNTKIQIKLHGQVSTEYIIIIVHFIIKTTLEPTS